MPTAEPLLPDLLDAALQQQRQRAVAMGARVRLVGAALLLPLVSALWLLGGEDWKPYVLPLALYFASALALFLLRERRGVAVRALVQSLLDVVLVFWVQHEALPVSPFPAGVAGFSLGLFGLLVVLSGLTLSLRVTLLTAALGTLAQVALMREAGVGLGAQLVAGVVLFLIASVSQFGALRVRSLALGLTRVEVERQLEHRRVEEVEAAHAQLQRLQREKDALSELVVHDLRSPLTAVLLNLEWLASEVGPERPQWAESLRDCEALARRLTGMVTDLLEVSRLEEGRLTLKRTALSAARLVDEVRRQAAPLARTKGLQVEASVPPSLEVVADRALLTRVMENLAANAARHTPKGGRMQLEAQLRDDEVLLAVHNDGRPIPPPAREHLFDKFAQGSDEKNARSGWGLGLYFCRLAVEAHGGRIQVEDVPGWSTSFVVRLPSAPPSPGRGAG
ncbi:HAMP domain-containing histidine kinase [Aggregicoccus sp. 17bor-14]|uniref:sensor histidine kinase n=1 Tax=Myxococcaceae TaxID=31 RepID=UPI00129C87E2|nr:MULTISPECIES: HAMP domain-containing sensor histidine kinase [Myxococcaceae]MBF5042450.1 HAMP domain-containing histidine kinase [Simulacricoccus sp. 17bor-14]MRI88221.1 HAMP domain-containing histidine kinase [Aggregicoccus sp. 17bor-14]